MSNPSVVLLILLCVPILAFAGDGDPVQTDRQGARPLITPDGEPMWQFAIMGDRTGGPAEGIRILARAVSEVNLVEPDLVMTVGDLINGYNERSMWLIQAAEYLETMGRLSRPWYPVAGNHDVYWRGPDRPEEEHESNYEQHFGPLWYWFEHKNCAFITLYSDEGDPVSGRKDFTDPKCQRFSERQLSWLDDVLEKTGKLEKVFVFIHHPRWISSYYPGANWDVVHDKLAATGNVSAVFAGHIHRLHYGGKRDGIEYVTLATTGGHSGHEYPGAGWVHHWNLVTVRPSGIDMAVIPVGSVLDPRKYTDDRRRMTQRLLANDLVTFAGGLPVEGGASENRSVKLQLKNPIAQADLKFRLSSQGGEIEFPVQEVILGPEQSRDLDLNVRLDSTVLDGTRALPMVDVTISFSDEAGKSFDVPSKRLVVPLDFSGLPSRSRDGGHLSLSSPGDCVTVHARHVPLPQGPFTVEGWVKLADLKGRNPFLCKTNSAEYGIFLNDGKPSFLVHLDGKYATAEAENVLVQPRRWHHVAGVYDGKEVRVYLDGRVVGRVPASGKRTTNSLPFIVGADPDGAGRPTDSIEADIDGVRISKVARYGNDAFSPVVDPALDSETLIQLPLDWQVAGYLSLEKNGKETGATARIRGSATCISGSATVQ